MNYKILEALLGRSLIALSGLGVTYFLPQKLNLDQVGFIYLTITQITLLSVLFRFGVDYTITPILADTSKNNEIANVIGKSIALIVLMSIIIQFFYILIIYIANPFDFEIISNLWLLSIWIWGVSLSICLIVFQVFRIQGHVLKATLTRGLLTNAAILSILLFIGDQIINTNDIIFFFSIQMLLLTIIISWSAIKNISISTINNHHSKITDLISKRFFIYSILSVLSSDIDYLMVAYFLDNESMALYSSAKRLSIISAIFIDLANLTLPSIYKTLSIEGYEKKSQYLSATFFVSSLAILIIFVVYSKQVTSIFFGNLTETQREEISYLIIIFIANFTLTIAIGFAEILLIMKNEKNPLIKGNIIGISIFLLLSPILSYQLSYFGIAISFLISNVILRLYLSSYVLRKYKINLFIGLSK